MSRGRSTDFRQINVSENILRRFSSLAVVYDFLLKITCPGLVQQLRSMLYQRCPLRLKHWLWTSSFLKNTCLLSRQFLCGPIFLNAVNGKRVLYKVKKKINDINTQISCIDRFERTTKNLTMEDIKVIFEKMLKEHEESVVQKSQEMFQKQAQFILVLISENNSLTKPCLDRLSKDINDLKESLEPFKPLTRNIIIISH